MNHKKRLKIDASQVKMIVCDLDGTLLNHQKKITPATAAYLIELQKKGYTLVLASGRFYYELNTYIKQLNMDQYGGYAICANGLEIHDIVHQTMHCFDRLSKEDVDTILSHTREHHITSYANVNHSYHASCTGWLYHLILVLKYLTKPFSQSSFYPIRLLRETDFQKVSSSASWGTLDKICFLSSHHKLEAFRKQVLTSYPKAYRFYYINRFAIEIVKHSVGKKDAVAYLCAQKSLSLNNVLAFGDSGNDEDLLQDAGIGITMKNGFYQTKQKAKILSEKTNQQEGVLDMLKRLPL